MMSAAASLGLVLLWNVDEGLNQVDKFFHQAEVRACVFCLLSLFLFAVLWPVSLGICHFFYLYQHSFSHEY